MTPEAPWTVVDASVVVKWFARDGESGLEGADRLLADHIEGDVRLVAPSLVVHELLNVARRKSRQRAVLAEVLEAFFDVEVLLVPPDRDLMSRTAALVHDRELSTFDAAYAALAESLDCPLATADLRFARALGEAVETVVV